MTEPGASTSGGLSLSRVLSFILGAAVVLFAVVNAAETSVNFLAFSVTLPLFLLILATALVGFVAGFLARGRAR